MSQENTFTLNKLQTFDDCPKKYKYCYIDNVYVIEPYSHTKTGNNIHNLINYYYKNHDITKLVESLNAKESLIWRNFKNSDICTYNCITTEYSFNLKVENYWLSGRIDALFENQGRYLVADWKTGETFSIDNAKFQTAFYLFCLYEILKTKAYIESPEDLLIVYFNLVTNSLTELAFNRDLYMQFKTMILSIIYQINSATDYVCRRTDRCKLCKYFSVCS